MAKSKEAPAADNAVVSVEEQLKKQLAGLKDRIGAPPSNRIKTTDKKFTLPDGTSDTALSVVILDWRYVLAHYPGVYKAGNPQDPDCFAVGIPKPESGQLVPHESVPEPHSKDCASCPKNQWKSSPSGGKACKNKIRLLVTGGELTENSKPLTLYISPTGLKNFFAYTNDLAKKEGLLLQQVITNITCDPDVSYPRLQFELGGKHAQVELALALQAQFQDIVEAPIEFKDN